MKRELTPCQKIEQSITKKYRETIWQPFIASCKHYELIEANDKIAVCISGGKDSMLLAKCMIMLNRYSEIPFELKFVVMDPGYNPQNRRKIEDNARLLEIPIEIFETDIFHVADKQEKNPCYLCAKMRRGHLYAKAKELGCNKIALGHHFSDVIETTVLSMFYGNQLQGMLPKLHSTNFEKMELIRPLYRVHEDAIKAWCRYNSLEFIACACRFTERDANHEASSKRREIKDLIAQLKKTNPNIEMSIFNAVHSVNIDTFPGYKTQGKDKSFLDKY